MKRIFVTGGNGYLAKHVIKQLLAEGYQVRASVRDTEKGNGLIRAVSPGSPSELTPDLEIVELDLIGSSGWREAMSGCDAVVHIASPFPLVQPRNEQDLIAPALSGTTNILKAAVNEGIQRAVITSSIAAIIYPSTQKKREYLDESSWTDTARSDITPYAKSKTLAERTAWSLANESAHKLDITVINPGFIVGPPLDHHIGSSLATIQRLMRGSDPMLPNFGLPTVDVRDVAALHAKALSEQASIGQRLIASERFLWYPEMARLLQEAYPERHILKRTAPDIAMRLMSTFDKSAKSILPDLGRYIALDSGRAEELLGTGFRDVRSSIQATAHSLIELGLEA